MERTGLKQLTERFIRVNRIMNRLERKHSLGTYKRLASLSKNLKEIPAELIESYFSTSERYSEMIGRLDKHKEASIIGITGCIDDLLDNISDEAIEGNDYSRLEENFNLMVDHCLPLSYSEQAEEYRKSFDETLYNCSVSSEAYSEVAA